MVRKRQETDIDAVAEIWLDTNLKAHNFISERYWEDNFQAVKELLQEAELYVCEYDGEIQGFIGLDADYIAGLFVRSEAQSRGIGKQMIDFVKGIRRELTLSVYKKNLRAVKFYQREEFQFQEERTDENTGEIEYWMFWKRKNQRA